MTQEITGKVVAGAKRGRELGFPTANIAVTEDIPEGIFLSKVLVDDTWHNGLTFIGKAETFNEKEKKAESFLLDFSGDLYGKEITIQLLKKIRDNEKFTNVDSLIKQMNNDVTVARGFFSSQS